MQGYGGVSLLDGREVDPLLELLDHSLVQPEHVAGQRDVEVRGAYVQVADVVVGEWSVGLALALPLDGLVEVADALDLHLVYRAVVEGYTQGAQSGEALENVHRHPGTGRHALEPAPAAVAALEVLQFEDGLAREAIGPVGVEESGQLLHALGLVIGLEHPGGSREEYLLQLFVPGQQRGEVPVAGGLPQLDGAGDERVAAGHRCGQAVGIERGRDGDGVVAVDVGQGGHRLYGIPGGVVAVLQRHAQAFDGGRFQFLFHAGYDNRDGLLAAGYVEGFAVGHQYAGGEHG